MNNITKKNKVRIIAGPCAVESQSQIDEFCSCMQDLGLEWLRGGAFKPRVNPHSFQGLGEKALHYLSLATKKYNLKCISEVVDINSLDSVIEYCDAVQIGTRNMSNFSLLKTIGEKTKNTQIPILLKRGMSSKITEWLLASEYIKEAGNNNIVLCERGIRTFEDTTRFTLDISAVAVVHRQSLMPVCVDVSHAAGNWYFVPELSRASLAVGADAIMIEVHPNPKSAKCDSSQQLDLKQFSTLVKDLRNIAQSFNKEII